MNYKVVEKFISINGEGLRSGQLSVFIRFAHCNLDCIYCDTKWANNENVKYEIMTQEEIYSYIKGTGIKNVTLTGGEPLLQKGMHELLELIASDNTLNVEIETNGSICLNNFLLNENRPSFNMDYKLPESGMENFMETSNFKYLTKKDVVKFVVSSLDDLKNAKNIIDKFSLLRKTNIYLSPVFHKISPETIVNFMKDNKLNDVTLQIQIHKIIWDSNKRGV
ncbi:MULTISPECIES: putative 7-carboxy-7-deazaguanine synthase QueE [Clostridium]|uniref:putative 7-carboxy-7-deazaguanine synthase QueE n=1 Tax=Clostridium TaxID=1485 RepID=UPI000824743D|nr:MULTISPECIES: putative 7-carboxy-7-deazaguanine synthase QueE [Clostridium]PJI08454.1 putative 7-carboxy-7-deazaguanine synthase QueE [Clostridium sp. CT7]